MVEMKAIPRLTAEEEIELLARWHKYRDKKARKRVIEGSLYLVPPIANSQARKFNIDNQLPELVLDGNLALVKAFDASGLGGR